MEKQKRQRLVNRCAIHNDTHIFMIDEIKISNYGMIKGYFRLHIVTKENFDKYYKMSSEEKTYEAFFDLCDEAKNGRAFLFSLTDYIQSNYKGFEGVKDMTQLVQSGFRKSKESGSFDVKSQGKWFEFKSFPKEK